MHASRPCHRPCTGNAWTRPTEPKRACTGAVTGRALAVISTPSPRAPRFVVRTSRRSGGAVRSPLTRLSTAAKRETRGEIRLGRDSARETLPSALHAGCAVAIAGTKWIASRLIVLPPRLLACSLRFNSDAATSPGLLHFAAVRTSEYAIQLQFFPRPPIAVGRHKSLETGPRSGVRKLRAAGRPRTVSAHRGTFVGQRRCWPHPRLRTEVRCVD